MRARNFLRSGWLNVGCQILFLLVLYLIGSRGPFTAPIALYWIVSLLIVLVPSALWTAFFYLQDRAGPEPTRHVIASFLFGVAGASAFALPIEQHFFTLDVWMYESMSNLALGSTLVRGTLASLVICLGVRYGFVPLAEFDEAEDGMVYGAFIGSGFAAVKTLMQLGPQLSPTLFAIAYTASTNILVYASIGAVVGYLVGRGKFGTGDRQRSSLLAVLLGPLLFGTYHVLREFVFLAGLQNTFWASFALSVVFASVLLGVVARLMAKLTVPTTTPPPQRAWAKASDATVLAAVALLLGAGAVARAVAMRPASVVNSRFGIAFEYPANQLTPRLGLTASSGDPLLLLPIFEAAGNAGGPFSITVSAKAEKTSLDELNPMSYVGRIDPLSFSTENLAVGGRRGLRVKYSYVRGGEDHLADFADVRWAYTDIIPIDGSTIVFSYQAGPSAFVEQEHLYRGILGSVTWPPSGGAAR
jgi:RsiW-degrading membrane proteinase PrsW (M82 family)